MARSQETVDLSGIKGRVAEALVESIFRRVGYKMTRFGKESDLRGMLKVGRDEDHTPDFLALKEGLVGKEAPGIYHNIPGGSEVSVGFGSLSQAARQAGQGKRICKEQAQVA